MSGRLLGVLGGMGVQATTHFCNMITDLQNVEVEQEYLDMLVYSKPSIPNRTAYILGQSDTNPLHPILQAAHTLEKAGASHIAMPCVTAHFFYKDLAAAINIPFLNMLDETARFVASRNHKKIGLLATSGTLQGKFFHHGFDAVGISVVQPCDEEQKALMDIIYDLKSGKATLPGVLEGIASNLHKNGAEAIVLGCTELSLLSKGHGDYIDTMMVLAKAALAACKAK